MRIGVVGNCQSGIISQWLTKMLPDDEIVHHSIGLPSHTYGPAGEDLAECDVIISQWIGPDAGPLSSASLSNIGAIFVQVPNMVFTGFQPDMSYLYYESGDMVVSPVGAYHSRIISSCFFLGLGPIRTRKMFNSYIFEILGFFEEYGKAALNLDAALAQQGIPVTTKHISEHGPFMHTINHANAFAYRTISFEAARKAGLMPLPDADPIVDEMLDDTVWPIYPQIADRLAIDDGSMLFTRASHLARDGRTRSISLEQMIEESFEIYSRDKAIIDFRSRYEDADILRSNIRRKYL